jgi:hypothetical protein
MRSTLRDFLLLFLFEQESLLEISLEHKVGGGAAL